jgi:hypothetical protein
VYEVGTDVGTEVITPACVEAEREEEMAPAVWDTCSEVDAIAARERPEIADTKSKIVFCRDLPTWGSPLFIYHMNNLGHKPDHKPISGRSYTTRIYMGHVLSLTLPLNLNRRVQG